MSLLTICAALAANVGIETPTRVVGSPDREMVEALQFANETGEELARRVDWSALRKTVSMSASGAMPADFSRLSTGICAMAGGSPVRPLTPSEWRVLAGNASTGVARYLLLSGATVTFWPAPTSAVTVTYQSRNWLPAARSFASDSDVPLVDEALFARGLIVRWRRQKGMSYADEEAEFEAMLADKARADDRSRL